MIKGLHIELTNKCTLKCPRCSRTEFIEQFPTKWKNKELDLSELKDFLDIDLLGKTVNLCGNYGDPIYYNDLIEVVKFLKEKGTSINIATNGSYKSGEWWEELVGQLDQSDSITFAIDGIPENFTKYRINADWTSILDGINVVARSSVRMIWQYILFSYNMNSVMTAKKLSNELGFDEFFTMDSGRWDNRTEWLTPDIDKLSESKQLWKKGKDIDVDPRCLKHQNYHYISADGFYTPCCFMSDHRFYYKSEFYKNKNTYDISSTTLSKILSEPNVVNFYNTLGDEKLDVCQFNCPRIQDGI